MAKVENVTLVITDPCYVTNNPHAKQYINESTIYGDWSCMCYKYDKDEAKKKSEEWDKFYFDFFNKYNFTGLNKEEKKALSDEFDEKKRKFIEENCYGEFCADSGRVAVYDYNTLSAKNIEWFLKHPHCYCVVPNYSGTFDYVVEYDDDGHRSAHIVGDGFYTTQSGL